MNVYYNKYIKYKNKYFLLKNQFGGNIEIIQVKGIDLKYQVISSITELDKIKDDNKIHFLRNNPDIVKDKSKVIFYFGHYGDNFLNYSRLLRFYDGHIVHFKDFNFSWYENLIEPFKQYILDNFNDINNYLFIGPSMGGYASLYLSLQFPDKNCVCIAIGAQTLQLDKKIYLHNTLDYLIPDRGYDPKIKKPLIHQTNIKKDIAELLKENPDTNTKIFLINSKFECEPYCLNDIVNHQEFIFLDNLHAGSIINFDNVKLILYNSNEHSLASNINLKDLFNFFNNKTNFNLLFTNQNEGVKILNNNINNFIRTTMSTPIGTTPIGTTPLGTILNSTIQNLISLDENSINPPLLSDRIKLSLSDFDNKLLNPTPILGDGAASSN